MLIFYCENCCTFLSSFMLWFDWDNGNLSHDLNSSDWPVGPLNPPPLLSFITPDNHCGLHGPFEATELQRGQKDNFSIDNNNRQSGSVAWFASWCRNGVRAHWLSRFLCFNDVCVLKGRHSRKLQLADQWFQSNQSLNEAHSSGATPSTFFQTLQWLISHVTPECSKHVQLVWTFYYPLLCQKGLYHHI